MLPKYLFTALNVYTLLYLLMFTLVDYSPAKIALLSVLALSFSAINKTPQKTLFMINATAAFTIVFITPSPLLQMISVLTGIFSLTFTIAGMSSVVQRLSIIGQALSVRLQALYQPHLYFVAKLLISIIGFSVFVTTTAMLFMDRSYTNEVALFSILYGALYLYGVIKLWSENSTLTQTVIALFFVFDMLFSVLPLQMHFDSFLDTSVALFAYFIFIYLLLLRTNDFLLNDTNQCQAPAR